MKTKLFLLFVIFVSLGYSQNNNPKEVVEQFFVAFHGKDSTMLKQFIHSDIILRTISNTKEGNKLTVESINDFIKSIVSIPDNMNFFEKIIDYKVEIDGNLAHVWTPYEFYVNDKLSHIGANAFTLYNDNGKWQIIHLIDTRRKK